MSSRFPELLRTGAPRSKSGPVFAGILCMLIIVFLAGCGGDSSSSPGTAAGNDTTSTSVPATEMNPGEVGDAIAAKWSEAIQELVALLADQPEPAAVKSEVKELKESYVTQLVALGQMREALSDGAKAQVDAGIQAGLAGAADAPWFVSYVDIYNAYPEDDLEFKNLLASFNILAQYADFDLLKQQEPDEAARLGIE